MTYDAFISYHPNDRNIAEKIAHVLDSYGVITFIDVLNLQVGERIFRGLDKALKQSNHIITLVGKEGLDPWFFRIHLPSAFYLEIPIILVYLPNADLNPLPSFMLGWRYIEYDESMSFIDRLAAAILDIPQIESTTTERNLDNMENEKQESGDSQTRAIAKNLSVTNLLSSFLVLLGLVGIYFLFSIEAVRSYVYTIGSTLFAVLGVLVGFLLAVFIIALILVIRYFFSRNRETQLAKTKQELLISEQIFFDGIRGSVSELFQEEVVKNVSVTS